MEYDQTIFNRQLMRFKVLDKEERCALLLLRRGVDLLLYEVRNTHPDPAESFRISRLEMGVVFKENNIGGPDLKWIGFLHTHRTPHPWKPSEEDHKGAARYLDKHHAVYHPFLRRLTWFNTLSIISYEKIKRT